MRAKREASKCEIKKCARSVRQLMSELAEAHVEGWSRRPFTVGDGVAREIVTSPRARPGAQSRARPPSATATKETLGLRW